MKVKVGNFYRLYNRKGKDRGGQWECVKVERNKAQLKQESMLIIGVPCSLIFIKPTSQVFFKL